MLIENARFVVTQNDNRDILRDQDIRVSGGEIVEIGEDLSGGGEVVDASDRVVMPGLVNCHNHSPMALFRGMSDDEDLEAWLGRVEEREDEMSGEAAYLGALLSMMEMLAAGTTTFADMYSYPDEIIDAVEETGIRAFLCSGLRDTGEGKSVESELSRNSELLAKIGESGDRVNPALGLHWTLTCSDELISEVAGLEKDLPLFMHVSETLPEVEKNVDRYGRRPLERLDDTGVLEERFAAVHSTHLSDAEKDIMADRGVNVVHNPMANLKLADGIGPVRSLRERGVNVSLGTDSAASNDNLDMFEEMKVASSVQKAVSGDASAVDAQSAVDMATRNAARTCMEDRIGSIEVGNFADLVMVDVHDLSLNPVLGKDNLLSNLVYGFRGRPRDVIVGGDPVIRDGEFVDMDPERVYQETRRLYG